MGSLTSRPKIPSFTPSSVATIAPVALSSAPVKTATVTPFETSLPSTPEADRPEEAAPSSDEVRVENLLRRNRGLTGTILTGFRGLLSENDLLPKRKTLLGE